MRNLIERAAGSSGLDSTGEVIAGTYRRLASTKAMLVAVTLEDALAVAERPNMPGTTDGWPNWRIPLPIPLEELFVAPGVMRLAEALRSGRLTQGPRGDGAAGAAGAGRSW
jgi:4-alpha-glucanotransferase